VEGDGQECGWSETDRQTDRHLRHTMRLAWLHGPTIQKTKDNDKDKRQRQRCSNGTRIRNRVWVNVKVKVKDNGEGLG
jgi:hypothetical protein